jgi:ATP-dependent Clp endopeptidase proteolytic subunit ClpP
MNTAAQTVNSSHRYRFGANAGGEQILDIFNEIDDWWGVGVPALASELSRLNASRPLTVRIHSPGGSVTEGLGIRNLLRAWPGDLTTVGVGFVASIASVILLAGKRVKMADNAYLMIHRPYGGVMGNADEMRQTADVLSSMDENLLDIYTEAIQRRGNNATTREEVFEMMKKETWMTAREAYDLGFIDEVVTAEELPVSASAFKALAKYDHAPDAVFTHQKNDTMNVLEQIRALLTPDAATPPVAEVETPVAEVMPEATIDPVEEARQLLEQAGYAVTMPEAEPTADEQAELVNALAQLQAEIKALRTQASKAKAAPSGGATTDKAAAPAARSEREKAFDGFAQFVKQKIQMR